MSEHDRLYSWDEVAAGLEQTAQTSTVDDEHPAFPLESGIQATLDDPEFADMEVRLSERALVQLRVWMDYLDGNDYWTRADASLMGAAQEIVSGGYSDGLPPTAVAIILYMGTDGD